MVLEMKMPSPGESITEVEIAQWLVEDGEYVERDQIICEIDSEKATLELAAEDSGAVQIVAQEGDTVDVGSVVCKIDTSAKGEAKAKPVAEPSPAEAPAAAAEEAKPEPTPAVKEKTSAASGHPSPAAKKRMDEAGIKPGSVSGTGKGGRGARDHQRPLRQYLPRRVLPGQLGAGRE